MAIYSLHMTRISRKKGMSSVAAAAYRSGESLFDDRTGQRHDYSRKRGVGFTHVVLPPDAPEYLADREELWNTIERHNRRRDSLVAREIRLALPAELSAIRRESLALRFASELSHVFGMAVDIAVHAPSRGGDKRNHHAHLLCSANRITPEGVGKKIRELDAVARDRDKAARNQMSPVEWMRERWAELVNEYLQLQGASSRVDHRSYLRIAAESGASQVVIPTIHLGAGATTLERRGHRTARGDHNREVLALREDEARLRQLEIDIAQTANATVPDLIPVASSAGAPTVLEGNQIHLAEPGDPRNEHDSGSGPEL